VSGDPTCTVCEGAGWDWRQAAEVNCETNEFVEDEMLRHLDRHGVLHLATELMNEDRRGVRRQAVSVSEAMQVVAETYALAEWVRSNL
jgi:hypothetical protein